jgi:uncharacterized protein YceH (UPF0502 family)
MHPFEDLSSVAAALQRLMQREPALVSVLPRQPGTKEARYAHLLSGEVAAEATGAVRPTGTSSPLEAQVEELRKDLKDLKREFEEFRKKFE